MSKKSNSVCPNCGYCPHCGRGGKKAKQPHETLPVYPNYPTYPTYPIPWTADPPWQIPPVWVTTSTEPILTVGPMTSSFADANNEFIRNSPRTLT